MDLRNAQIAIVTDDGVNVSSHFGRAPFYEVVEMSDGKVIKRERREKAGHHVFASEEGSPEHNESQGRQHRHQAMLSPIMDCQVVVVGGMGQGAANHFREANLTPVLTGLRTIEEVIHAIASGSLDNDPSRIHMNRG
jgi:predicted Fe-Mo cluster-binding NifX family protein